MLLSFSFFLLLRLSTGEKADPSKSYLNALQMLALLTCGIYFLAIFNFFWVSKFIIFSVSAEIVAYQFYKKKIYLNSFDFFIFLILGILTFFAQSIELHDWDDFSHWAVSLKNLKLTAGLPTNSLIDVGASYIPGISLWLSLLSPNDPSQEGSSYAAAANFISFFYFCATAVVIMQDKTKSINKQMIFFLFALIFYFVFSEKAGGLFTLSVDHDLSIFFVSALLSLCLTDFKSSSILLLVSLIMLCLTKHTGVLFSSLALVIWLAEWGFKQAKTSKLILLGSLSFFIIFILKISWNNYLAHTAISVVLQQNTSLLPRIIEVLLNFKSDRLFLEVLPQMFERACLSEFTKFLFVGILLFEALHFKIFRKLNKRFFAYSFFSILCYFIFLAFCYRFIFGEYEAKSLASFDRYFETITLSWVLFFTFQWILLAENLLKSRSWSQNFSYALSVIFLAPISYDIYKRKTTCFKITNRAEIQKQAEGLRTILPPNAKVYFIWQYSTGLECLMMRYELMPRLISCDSSSLGEPSSSSDVWTHKVPLNEFATSINNYDYVLVAKDGGSL